MNVPRLWVVLVGWACLVPMTEARPPFRTDEPANQSHRWFDNADLNLDEKTLEDRLRGQLRNRNNPDREIKRLAETFLTDPKFRESLEKHFTPENLREWQKKLNSGEANVFEPLLRKLEQDETIREILSKAELVKLQKWLKDNPVEQNPNKVFGSELKSPENRPPQPQPDPVEAAKSILNQRKDSALPALPAETADWLKKNLETWMDSLDKWADSPSGKSWRETLREVIANGMSNQSINPEWIQKARGLAGYLPRMDQLLPPRENLPGIEMPSMPQPPPISFSNLSGLVPRLSSGGLGNLLVLLLLVVVGVLLTRLGQRMALSRFGPDREKPLGPWPVRPQEVASSEELVRAFEYLAILLLGPAARFRNHRQIAEQLASRPCPDQERHQDGVRFLTELYEQARYAPEGLQLAEPTLLRVRRELCHLSGESEA
jgi:hypothetical protein